jgi:PBP1b-binding outer membrane lipoprotein LpoB
MTTARHARRLAALAAVALLAVSCGQSKAPKVDAATERAQALERAKKGPLGTQVNALETAKSIEADVNQKAQDQVDRVEKDAK